MTEKRKRELLQQYIAGTIDTQNRHLLEREAVDDIFLFEALEGYTKHMSSTELPFYSKSPSKALPIRTFMTMAASFLVLATVAFLIKQQLPPTINEEAMTQMVAESDADTDQIAHLDDAGIEEASQLAIQNAQRESRDFTGNPAFGNLEPIDQNPTRKRPLSGKANSQSQEATSVSFSEVDFANIKQKKTEKLESEVSESLYDDIDKEENQAIYTARRNPTIVNSEPTARSEKKIVRLQPAVAEDSALLNTEFEDSIVIEEGETSAPLQQNTGLQNEYNSFVDQRSRQALKKDFFEFTIHGKVSGHDGIELALYIPSQGLDKRIKSTIRNGEYSFSGIASEIEEAYIRFEESIISNSIPYSSTPVIIEKGITEFNFGIEYDPTFNLKSIYDPEILQGPNNVFYYSTNPAIREAGSTWVYGDSIRRDSMIRYEYPGVRRKVIDTYAEICSKSNNDEICLIHLHNIVEGFVEHGPFDAILLNSEERQAFTEFLADIDGSLHQKTLYKKTERYIYDSFNLLEPVKFKDYELENIDGGLSSLSKIIRNNSFTVLYFWWSGCGPCRKFNKKDHDQYLKMKQNGIEIIGINVDQSRERWINSSKTDKIQWSNLYAGDQTFIVSDYQVYFFPKKIIFDQKQQLVEFEFKDIEELLSLVKND